MSIVHMDNFSAYGRATGYMTNNIYAEINSGIGNSITLEDDPDGVSPGTVMNMHANFDNESTPWRYASPQGAKDTMGFAFRYWIPNLPVTNNEKTKFAEFRNNANVTIGSLAVLSTGALRFRIFEQTFDTPVPVVSANGWYHYEVKYDNTGANEVTLEIRIEGVTVLTEVVAVTVQDPVQSLQPSQIAAARANISGDGATFYKDLVIWDGEGAQDNDFLGSVLVVDLTLTADLALNWMPTPAGTGYTILDNRPPNDAQFISAGDPPPDPYEASLSSLPLNVTSVKAVMTYVRAGKVDGGDAMLQVGLISDGDTILGSNRPITTSPTYWRDFFELDPHTDAPWTPAAVNAVTLQIDRTA